MGEMGLVTPSHEGSDSIIDIVWAHCHNIDLVQVFMSDQGTERFTLQVLDSWVTVMAAHSSLHTYVDE